MKPSISDTLKTTGQEFIPMSQKTDLYGNVRAAVFSNLYCFYLPVGYNLSAYDGGTEVKGVALNKLLLQMDKFTNAVNLSDS